MQQQYPLTNGIAEHKSADSAADSSTSNTVMSHSNHILSPTAAADTSLPTPAAIITSIITPTVTGAATLAPHTSSASSSPSASPYSSPHSSPRLRARHTKTRSTDRTNLTTTGNNLLINSQSKWQSAQVRLTTTVVLLSGFIAIIYLGHIPLMLLVFACQLIMFKEIKQLSRVLSKKQTLASFEPLSWYWFAVSIFFIYGRLFDYYFHIVVPFHTFLSFSFYCIGVLLFVWSLKKGYYKYQFEMFAWIHLTLLLIVVQSTFTIINIFHGLVWFLLPALLIISNDCWAYICGFFFGRTPLIRLSPKKTWEGFIGAFVMTLVSGLLLTQAMIQYEFMVCPKSDFSLFTTPHCVPPDPFLPRLYVLPHWLHTVLPILPHSVYLTTFHGHMLVLSVFASLIAPFGGFFASGFKRAFHIKDFGESLPGHGGVTDRMDCQVLMGAFVWVYYGTFVVQESSGDRYGKIMRVVERMGTDEIQRLYWVLHDLLIARGVDLIRGIDGV